LAIVVVCSSLADALLPFLLDARMSSLGGCFATMALSLFLSFFFLVC
jgi:hypothetical protein